MAFLRETPGTLRAYLLIAGVLGGLSNLSLVIAPGVLWWGRLLGVPALLLSAAYFYLGVTLESQLRSRPSQVLMLFRLAMGLSAAYLVIGLVVALATRTPPIPIALIGLLIAWYLYVQTRRLIQEAKDAATGVVADVPARSEPQSFDSRSN